MSTVCVCLCVNMCVCVDVCVCVCEGGSVWEGEAVSFMASLLMTFVSFFGDVRRNSCSQSVGNTFLDSPWRLRERNYQR